MHSIDDVERILEEIAEELPEGFFRQLNGGIILLEEAKIHPRAPGLCIMGEYSRRHDLGRYITIYYGSFARVYGHAPEAYLRKKLRETLLHEFTHHLESLAGERGLEIQDRIDLAKYLEKE
ncbi:MAG: metallopeptidase family protein [Oscillospiraceae bacterium]|nr:metallopeptidase family protein [Oscillospiraceae bacterium]